MNGTKIMTSFYHHHLSPTALNSLLFQVIKGRIWEGSITLNGDMDINWAGCEKKKIIVLCFHGELEHGEMRRPQFFVFQGRARQ